jgi:hypothetical protein
MSFRTFIASLAFAVCCILSYAIGHVIQRDTDRALLEASGIEHVIVRYGQNPAEFLACIQHGGKLTRGMPAHLMGGWDSSNMTDALGGNDLCSYPAYRAAEVNQHFGIAE